MFPKGASTIGHFGTYNDHFRAVSMQTLQFWAENDQIEMLTVAI